MSWAADLDDRRTRDDRRRGLVVFSLLTRSIVEHIVHTILVCAFPKSVSNGHQQEIDGKELIRPEEAQVGYHTVEELVGVINGYPEEHEVACLRSEHGPSPFP